MTCPTIYTQIMLDQALAAYHNLMTGTAVVEVTDQNGERVTFNRANRADLYAYIQRMQAALNTSECAASISSPPLGFTF